MKRLRDTLASLLALGLLWPAGPSSARADERAPSPEELRALVDRVIANQHRDAAALLQYERIERRRVRKSEHDTVPIEDKTFRVVPTGTGTMRIQIEENGRPVDAAFYRKQLHDVEQVLVVVLDPSQLRQKLAVEKFEKRSRERREMVDAVRDAFRVTWLGRETRNGRALAKLRLDPNPSFRPTLRETSYYSHLSAVAWVDEAAAQWVRLEAQLISDISFGGGLIGKVYRGGRFVTEQAEVAPGIWLPTRYEYNVAGRKFLFSAELHEITEASHYRRIGPPKEALITIRRELAREGAARSDP